MTWQTHFVGGIASISLLAVAPHGASVPNVGVLTMTGAFAALLPDLDADKSKIRSLEVARVRPFNPLGDLINAQFGHRGFLHSPWALMIVAGLSVWIGLLAGAQIGLAFFLGYASHLALDACTKSGISGFRCRFYAVPSSIRVVTGSVEEGIYLAVMASIALACIYML